MTSDTLQTIGKYLIALVALIGCFVLIYTAAAGANQSEDWTVIGLIVGWIVRDSAGTSATSNAVKTIAAASPNPPSPGGPTA